MEGSGSSRPDQSKESEDIRERSGDSLEIIYTNAQSIVNKIDELRSVVSTLKPDIILINESWTHNDITKAYLEIAGYELSGRQDRIDTVNGRGGGLLVYSKLGLTVTEVEHKTDFNQVVAV